MATLRWLAILVTACVLAALSATSARASMGLAMLPATATDGPVTVFYPSSSKSDTIARGEFRISVAVDGAPVRGNGRLIMISHGSGGSPWTLTDFTRYLVDAGFIVAMPKHAGDNWHDFSEAGPQSWARRPLEVARAIDSVGRDTRFAALVDLSKVGVWGMSAGGHTALTLAGGRWSASRLRDHCQAHIAEDAAACTGGAIEINGGPFDGLKKAVALPVIRFRLKDVTPHGDTDPRIKAIIAGVPFAADFDLATLAAPPVALGLVQGERDLWLVPKFHSQPLIAACKTCEVLASLPTAGHGALLGPLPQQAPAWLHRLLDDPPGFNRAADTAMLYPRMTAFFQKHLSIETAAPVPVPVPKAAAASL